MRTSNAYTTRSSATAETARQLHTSLRRL